MSSRNCNLAPPSIPPRLKTPFYNNLANLGIVVLALVLALAMVSVAQNRKREAATKQMGWVVLKSACYLPDGTSVGWPAFARPLATQLEKAVLYDGDRMIFLQDTCMTEWRRASPSATP